MMPTANGNSCPPWWGRGLIAAGLMLALTACASTMISYSQLSALNKGMTPGETAVALKQPPASVHEIDQGTQHFTFHRYTMDNMVFTDAYLLCFEQDKLKYWGYLGEFRRHPDKDVSEAAEKAFDQILDSRKR